MEELIQEIFQNGKIIAVIGLKDDKAEPAYKVPYYMSSMGYKIYPVNPTRKDKKFEEENYVSNVTDIKVPVDIVNIFRQPKFLKEHAREILSMKPLPKYVWFQLGIRNDEAAELLEKAGIKVVQNRCIMVEHTRLNS
jgi:predicted CoA-binding protein